MRVSLLALALALAACSSPEPNPGFVPGPSPEAPPTTVAPTVSADSMIVDDPDRRLEARIVYPVLMGDAAAREAINEQILLVADGTWREMAPEEPLGPEASEYERYSFDGSYEVTHLGDGVLSLMQGLYAYTGGAHGNTFFFPQSYDLATGRPLALADAVQTTPDGMRALQTAVLDGLLNEAADRFDIPRETVRDEGYLWLDDVTATPEAFEGLWTLGADSLTVHYQPYAVSSYAAGTWHIPVAYADLGPHLGPVTRRLAGR
ncbi:MAG: DUF3298 and DUF4163 domain-containing protein [Bacteroidota bacterium]